MTKLRATDATLSSTYSWWRWPAAHIIDGNLNSICASRWQQNAWLSIELPVGSTIDYVAVYNRADHRGYADWLSPFEVWVGGGAGDTSSPSAVKCDGPVSVPWSNDVTPYMIACPHAVGSHVTLKQMGRARYLTVMEVEAFTTERQASATAQAVTKRGGTEGTTAAVKVDASHPAPIGVESAYYGAARTPAMPSEEGTTSMDVPITLAAVLAAIMLGIAVLISHIVRAHFALRIVHAKAEESAMPGRVKVMVQQSSHGVQPPPYEGEV